MKKRKKILFGIAAFFLIIQIPLFTPERNETDAEPEYDIATAYDVPMDILMHLYNSCYDCHSNYTREYPWYYHIQPVSWWMNLHIQQAKKELNFSEFANYAPEKATRKFEEIQEMMEEKKMPLKSYLIMHQDAKLSPEEYRDLTEWAIRMQEELRHKKDSAQAL